MVRLAPISFLLGLGRTSASTSLVTPLLLREETVLLGSVDTAASTYFDAHMKLCDQSQANCVARTASSLPQDEWSDHCDSFSEFGSSEVQWFWAWIDGNNSTQDATRVKVTLYAEPYCEGPQFEWDTGYQGEFDATMNPYMGASGWKLAAPQQVRSVRVSATGSLNDRGDMVGVKVVLFPLFDLDAQLKTLFEFTCDATVPGEYFDVGLATSDDPDFQTTWPSTCASPIDRVYCIERKIGGWGAVDDLPENGFSFAGDSTGAEAFEGTFPTRSAYVDRYYSSWEGQAPCRDPDTYGTFDALPVGTCVVTKLYTKPCTSVATSLSDWDTTISEFTLTNMGKCVNIDGSLCRLQGEGRLDTQLEPTPIRCIWSRVVDGPECANQALLRNLSSVAPPAILV